jgi:hypothetical protein
LSFPLPNKTTNYIEKVTGVLFLEKSPQDGLTLHQIPVSICGFYFYLFMWFDPQNPQKETGM